MRCPHCGAETQNSICEYCGSEIKQEQNVVPEKRFVNKAGCPSCGSVNIKFTREKTGTVKTKKGSQSVVRTVGLCGDCGYTWYPNQSDAAPTKKKTWLWVLGWIFIFPVPLTILMVRNKKLNKWVKIGLIAIAWFFYFIIASAGSGQTNEQEITDSSQQKEVVSVIEKETENVPTNSGETIALTKESIIEDLVNGYNASADDKLVFAEDFVVSSRDSGHYRTEFRLTAYNDAVGKSYKLGEQNVDIISTQSYSGDIDVRIYTDGATLELCKELIQFASQLLDRTMTDATVKETIDYISEKKEANGYYYGELGLLLLGSEAKGYDLMIKTD